MCTVWGMSATRKTRRKATTDLGRSILQRERQRLAREQAQIGEILANEARSARVIAEQHAKQNKPEQAAVSRGIVRRVAAVLASENVHPAIETNMSDLTMSTWTDFYRIHVTYRMHEDVRLTAATLRGLMYHEGGHIRWTVPFNQLLDIVRQERLSNHQPDLTFPAESRSKTLHRAWNALEDQRMETAVTSDSPRKAAYFTPMVLTELAETLDMAAANYPLLVWRRYLPRHIRSGARKLFVHKHGPTGEAIAQAIEATVERYVLATDAETMVECVVEMEGLLRSIQPLAYNLDNAGHNRQTRKPIPDNDDALTIPVDPSMIEDGLSGDAPEGDDIEPEIDTTDPLVAMHLSEVLSHLFIDPWNLIKVRYVIPGAGDDSDAGDDDEGQSGAGGLLDEQEQDDESDDDIAPRPEDEDEDEGDYFGPEDEDDEDEDFDGEGTDDDSDVDEDGAENPEHTGGSSGQHDNDGSDLEDDAGTDTSDDLTQEDLDKAIANAEDERLGDSALNGDVEAFQDALENQVSNLEPYIGGVSGNVVAQAEAEMLAVEIEQAFQAATIDRAPAWVEGQRRGIVNVQRYTTRQPGETEFFKAWVDDEQPGFDIAVSVLLDYSGSMADSLTALAQCGYASKLACQNLGIPCTVTLWDTDAMTLFDADERAEALPIIASAGGTDPEHALADLENQRHDKTKHIVLIMTDGSWSGEWEGGSRGGAKRSLAGYKTEGRTFIGFGYGTDALTQNLRAKGCDEAYAIKNLMDIPRKLETTLIAMA
jgi:hypothetical protein